MSLPNVLIVSPYFPPSSLAGVHRARHLAKYLPAAGWQPLVLCVNEEFHEEALDHSLAALVPATVETLKVSAIPTRFTRPLGFGEISLRAWRPLRRALFRLLATRPFSAVLITGSPFYPMLLAGEIKRRFGVPVILDFQDPWISSWGMQQNPFSKAGLSHCLATLLEPRAVRAADFVTSVSPIQNAEMEARYPWLSQGRMAAIPIGGDPDDLEAMPDFSAAGGQVGISKEHINLSYVGTIFPAVIDTLRTVLRGANQLRTRMPDLYKNVRLNFVGTSATSNVNAKFQVLPLAAREGVADIVHEVPQRLPYLQALSIQSNSQGILMLGGGERHYTASKIYAALMARRPFLSVFHRESTAHEILSRSDGGTALSFDSTANLASLETPIGDALIQLATAPGSLSLPSPAIYAPFEARAIAKQFGAIFDQLATKRDSQH